MIQINTRYYLDFGLYESVVVTVNEADADFVYYTIDYPTPGVDDFLPRNEFEAHAVV